MANGNTYTRTYVSEGAIDEWALLVSLALQGLQGLGSFRLRAFVNGPLPAVVEDACLRCSPQPRHSLQRPRLNTIAPPPLV